MLIGAGEIIDHAWDLYKKNFKKYLAIVVWALVPIIILGAAQLLLLEILPDRQEVITTVTFLLGLPVYLVSLYVQIAAVRATVALLRGEQAAPSKLLRQAAPAFFPTVITTVVVTVIMLAGFFALVVPGVIFSVWFAFAIFLTIIEGLPWREALRASRRLTSGRWFSVAWRLAAPSFFWILAVSVASSLLVFLANGLSGRWAIAFEGAPTWLVMINSVISSIIEGLGGPLLMISVVILLLDLKRESKATAESPN